jgi:hypothetical protein
MRGQEKAERGDKKAEEEHLKAKKTKVITTQDIVSVTTISPPIDTAYPNAPHRELPDQ